MSENTKKEEQQQIIDLGEVIRVLWSNRTKFFIMWPIVFALSALWVFPQPRYYTCEVELAPEGSEEALDGLAGIASSFGINIGDGASVDAIYPELYPDLFESPEFLVDLLNIKVETYDGTVHTSYYQYLKKYQKQNWLTKPFKQIKKNIAEMISPPEKENVSVSSSSLGINPFNMSKRDFELIQKVQNNIQCSVDKKTSVITLNVTDQDRMVCALLADSIKVRLEVFVIDYRTKKARADEKYYKHLADSAKVEYEKAVSRFAFYQDSHRNAILQQYVETGNRLQNDMENKQTAYNTFNTQYLTMKAKVQERTPTVTTLKSATVPLKPAGPKRMIFILGMLILSTLVASVWHARKILHFDF